MNNDLFNVANLNSFATTTVFHLALVSSTLAERLTSPPPELQNDPLVAHGWEKFAYIGAFLLVTVGIAIVGIISRKLEHALIFALALSLGLIGFFLLFNH